MVVAAGEVLCQVRVCAYTNIIEKMAVFAAIGACSAGWSRSVASGRRQLVIWCSLLAVIVLAFTIELVQIWLPPLVPDMSDTLVYLAGYGLGYYALVLVMAPATASPHFSHRDEYFPEDSLADLGLVLANPSLRYRGKGCCGSCADWRSWQSRPMVRSCHSTIRRTTSKTRGTSCLAAAPAPSNYRASTGAST